MPNEGQQPQYERLRSRPMHARLFVAAALGVAGPALTGCSSDSNVTTSFDEGLGYAEHHFAYGHWDRIPVESISQICDNLAVAHFPHVTPAGNDDDVTQWSNGCDVGAVESAATQYPGATGSS